MNELSVDWQREGDEHKTPQEISDELDRLAKKLGLGYTVPKTAWTPKEMTDQPIGQAMDVELNPAPLPGQPKATPRLGGANVVYQVFTSDQNELFRPNQAIAGNGTRYAFWKIEDHPRHVPEWDDAGIQDQVVAAWKTHKAREKAKARAEDLAKLVREGENKDIQKILEGQTITGKKNATKLAVQPAFDFSWMNPITPQFPRLELGTVTGVPKAGEDFMETAFHQLDVGDVGVLMNADGTEYYVGKVFERKYGEGGDLASLRESFLIPTDTPAHQTMNVLMNQQSQKLRQDWLVHFDKKYQVEVSPPPGQ